LSGVSDDQKRQTLNLNSPRQDSVSRRGTAPYRGEHLLPDLTDKRKGKKCLVLDLDETLVHSSFKPTECDFTIDVEIENQVHKVYVAKRPHVDEFMKRVGEIYEVVVFTASLAKYADPVLDLLDIHKVVDWRLFRESCSPFKGSYVKDMARMGRPLETIMLLDNSPYCYAFNPENGIPIESWFSDKNDTELMKLLPMLEKLSDPGVADVRVALQEMGISGLESLEKFLNGQAGEESFSSDEYSDYSDDDEYTGTEGSGENQ